MIKRVRRRISRATVDFPFDERDVDIIQGNLTERRCFPRRRNKSEHRRSGVLYARIALIYSLVAVIYSVSFLSSTSFLQVEVANAFAFKLPKPPRIVKDLINNARPTPEKGPIAPIIQDWSLNTQLSKDGVATYSLIGTVTGHPAIPDGDAVSTAPLEKKYVETALVLKSKGNSKPKFILKGQSSEYTQLVATISGTKYLLLPPNIKISNAPLLSKGSDGSDGPIARSLSYKDKLSYLEEQIEVVRLLAEREDEIERENQKVIRDAGIIVATALAGAAYIGGDNVDINQINPDPTAVINRVDYSKTESETSPAQKTYTVDIGEETQNTQASNEIEFAKPAKAILPYLEERIKALEEEQQKLIQRQNKNEVNEDMLNDKTRESETSESESKATSASKASVQEGMAKILADIKESIKQPDSESNDVANGIVGADTTEETADEERIESESNDSKSTISDEDNTSASVPKTTFQEGVTKLLTDVKESIKQPESESENIDNPTVGASTEENTITGEQIPSIQQQTDDKDTKSSSTLSKPSSVQEGVAKILADVKESVGLSDPEASPTDAVDTDTILEKIESPELQTELSGDKDTKSTSTASNREVMAKILKDFKESLGQSDSEVPPTDAGSEEIESTGQPAESNGDKATKSTSTTSESSSVQQGLTKILSDYKESLGQSKPEVSTTDVTGSDANVEDTKQTDSGSENTAAEVQSQTADTQESKVVEQIEKIAQDLSVIQKDTSIEIQKAVSDLAWAGKQLVGDDSAFPDQNINKLVHSALSIFGEDGIQLLSQYSLDAMKTVSDAFSLEQIWTELMEVTSKMKLLEDPRISQFLRENNLDERTSIQLVTGATLVAIVGVTTAVVMKSRAPDESEWSDEYWYNDASGMNQFDSGENGWSDNGWGDNGWSDNGWGDNGWSDNGWGPATDDNDVADGAGMGYAENEGSENSGSPFPFATSSWGDQSTLDEKNEYSASGWVDTSSSSETGFGWTQQGDGSVASTESAVENSSFEKSSSFSTGSEEEKVDNVNTSEVKSSPFSSVPTPGQESKGKTNFSPFGKNASKVGSSASGTSSGLPKDPKKTQTAFNESSTLPRNGVERGQADKKTFSPKGFTKNDFSTPKAASSPFNESSLPNNETPPKGPSPFGSPSAIPKAKQESDSDTTSSKKSFSPFSESQQTGMPPKKSFSSFGAPPPKSNQEENGTPTKKSFSPFGDNQQQSGMPSKKTLSSFGAPPPKSDQEENRTPAKKSFSPFGDNQQQSGMPSKKAFSSFGSPSPELNQEENRTPEKKTFSPFGEEQQSSMPSKKSFSSFGSPSPKSKQGESGMPAKKSFSSFGESQQSGIPQKNSFSSFGSPSPKSNQEESGMPAKKSFSPFGDNQQQSSMPTKKSFSSFGAPSTKLNQAEIGMPAKKTFSPFGEEQRSGMPSKKSVSAFGSNKQGSGMPAKKTFSPFGENKQQSGTPPKKSFSSFGSSKQESGMPVKKSFSSFGVQSSQSTQQENQERLEETLPSEGGEELDYNELTDPEPKSSDFRIKPKMASKPQNDMYERMQMEQAMRLAEFERKQMPGNKRSAPQGKMPFPKRPGQAQNPSSIPSAERRNIAAEKAEIEKEQRIVAEERARLNREKTERKEQMKQRNQTTEGQFEEEKRGNDYAANSEDDIELSEDERIEKERMKEIQRLAREQARFEIEARGLPKEEKNLQEKERMTRLHQLAREQARYEYDQRLAREKASERPDRVKSTNTPSVAENKENQSTEYRTSSKQQEVRRKDQDRPKQQEVRRKGQDRTSLFSTADTPSVEESMQNRVRQEFARQPEGEKPIPRTDGMQDPIRQVKDPSEGEALMGKKKKTGDRAGIFENPRVTLEKETTRGEKARREQLENLAKKQALYKKDRTVSTGAGKSSREMNKNSFFSKESGGQIIDVEAAEDDSGEVLKREFDTESSTVEQKSQKYKANCKKLEDKSQPPPQREKRQENSVASKTKEETTSKSDKRKQLEAQARQRSKQQYRRSDKMQTEQKDSTNQNRIVPDSGTTDPVVSEQAESQSLVPVAPERDSAETRQQKEVAEVIMKSDGAYRPSAGALSNTARLLKEVRGFSLSDYPGSKEFIHKKSNVSVYVGRTLSIPVRVSTPGSFIEFSIAKKASDFDMTILGVPDKGYAFDIKKTAPFTKYAGKSGTVLRDTVLIGAASTPCTLQFKFENKGSTLLDKVVVSYNVKVTSPSRELLLETRRRRAESCLQVIEKDIRAMGGMSKKSDLEKEIAKLEAEIKEKAESIDSLVDEEKRWNALIDKMSKVS